MSVAASESSVGAGEAGTAGDTPDGGVGGSWHAARGRQLPTAPLRRGAVSLPG
jgi:hypothetical protein